MADLFADEAPPPPTQEMAGANDLDRVQRHELHHVGRRRGRCDQEGRLHEMAVPDRVPCFGCVSIDHHADDDCGSVRNAALRDP